MVRGEIINHEVLGMSTKDFLLPLNCQIVSLSNQNFGFNCCKSRTTCKFWRLLGEQVDYGP